MSKNVNIFSTLRYFHWGKWKLIFWEKFVSEFYLINWKLDFFFYPWFSTLSTEETIECDIPSMIFYIVYWRNSRMWYLWQRRNLAFYKTSSQTRYVSSITQTRYMNRHCIPMYFDGHGGKVLRTIPFSCRILPYRFSTAANSVAKFVSRIIHWIEHGGTID